MIWSLLHILAEPDQYEMTISNGEIFVREIEEQIAKNMPAVSLDGDFFDHPDCRIPVSMYDEETVLADPIAAETRRLNAEARKAAEEVRGKIIKE